jgi:hypothetical protein
MKFCFAPLSAPACLSQGAINKTLEERLAMAWILSTTKEEIRRFSEIIRFLKCHRMHSPFPCICMAQVVHLGTARVGCGIAASRKVDSDGLSGQITCWITVCHYDAAASPIVY